MIAARMKSKTYQYPLAHANANNPVNNPATPASAAFFHNFFLNSPIKCD